MIDKKKFDDMRREIDKLERKREEAIELSRDIIKESKLAIYAVIRDNLNESEKHIEQLKKMIIELPKDDYDTGMAGVARQEYVEAITLYYYVKENKLIANDELKVDIYDYLAGLCDLTGELMRKAVNLVIKDDVKGAEKIRDFVDEIYHEFLKFNLRNGELRKKSDQIKWNLEKLENMMYDLKIKRG